MSILHAFTLTALDQFQQAEDKYGKGVDWKSVARKDLVVDMALNRNRFKTVQYMKWLSTQVPEVDQPVKNLLQKSKEIKVSEQ
jgi:hypothetical protein